MAKILVVDDRQIDREYLATLLGYVGHTVVGAPDGEEALRLARAQRPDLAIVDIVMPTMDGLEFVNRLRAEPALGAVRVIFYSASFLRNEAERLAVAGHVDRVLMKPSEPELILKAVNEELGVHAVARPPAMFEMPDSHDLVGVTRHKSQKELESVGQRLAVLVDLAREFTSVTDSDRLLERLGVSARSVVGARYAIVGLFHETRPQLTRMFVSGLAAGRRPPVPYPQTTTGMLAELLRPGTPVRRRGPSFDAGEVGLPEDVGRISTVLILPITAPGRKLGFLCLLNKTGADGFSEDEERIAETMASQAGVAYENIRLMRETQRRLEHVNALRAIDAAITGSLDLTLTLNVVLDQVISNLNVSATAVLLLDRGSNHLQTAAVRGFRSTQAARLRTVRLGEGAAGASAVERRIVGVQSPGALGPEGHTAPEIGGERFEAYFVAPLVAKGRILGVLEVYNRFMMDATPEWLNFLESLAGQTAIAIDEAALFDDLQRANSDLVQAYDSTLEGWVHALDLRDKETEGHTQRVTQVTVHFARSMGLTDPELIHVRRGALLHDIGKLGIPDAVLLKPSALSEDEWTIMKQHPRFAYEWLKPIAFLRQAVDIPYCHHEKWDGSGYPRGLTGDSIPLVARLFAVVDVWDALLSERPYRPAWSDEQVEQHLRDLRGKHFDPDAVDAFLKLPHAELRAAI